MKKFLTCMSITILSTLLLFGCAPQAAAPVPDSTQDNNAAGIILKGADEAKNIAVSDVISIELYDLEDNLVEKDLDKEIIVKAFNESVIDDTAYIAMITGYRMVITLKDNSTLTLTSYGNDTRVIAASETMSYHLISPELGKILLDN